MEPKEKEFYENVIIPKVWEAIPNEEGNIQHHLVTEPVSKYIRMLETDILSLRKFIADQIKTKNENDKK